MNCFGRLSNRFACEGCPIFYRNSVVCFQEQIAFVLKTVILLAFVLGIYVRESVRTRDMGWACRHSSRFMKLLECGCLPCMCT